MSVVWLFPFFYLLLQSFRGEPGAATLYFWPHEWTFNNYIKLFTDTQTFNFPKWYGTTLIISVVVTIVQTAIVLVTSYALSRSPTLRAISDLAHLHLRLRPPPRHHNSRLNLPRPQPLLPYLLRQLRKSKSRHRSSLNPNRLHGNPPSRRRYECRIRFTPCSTISISVQESVLHKFNA